VRYRQVYIVRLNFVGVFSDRNMMACRPVSWRVVVCFMRISSRDVVFEGSVRGYLTRLDGYIVRMRGLAADFISFIRLDVLGADPPVDGQ